MLHGRSSHHHSLVCNKFSTTRMYPNPVITLEWSLPGDRLRPNKFFRLFYNNGTIFESFNSIFSHATFFFCSLALLRRRHSIPCFQCRQRSLCKITHPKVGMEILKPNNLDLRDQILIWHAPQSRVQMRQHGRAIVTQYPWHLRHDAIAQFLA